MEDQTDLTANSGIEKLQKLVKEIEVCMFCTHAKSGEEENCRPMHTSMVDKEGILWFFSPIESEKNLEIEENNQVKLYFSHPGVNSYLIVNGQAEVILDKEKIDELWSPLNKAWFQEGKNDPNISILKVRTKSAYYWDVDGNSMVNFFKIAASAVTGESFVHNHKGHISVE